MGAIGAVMPVLAGVGSAISMVEKTLGAFQNIGGSSDRRMRDMQMKQAQQYSAMLQQQAAQDAVLEKEQRALESEADENDRRQALRRAVARQRANFGAQGIGIGDGSSEAVLLGMFEESEAQKKQREKLDSMRNRSLDLGLSQSGARDLLSLTQQAQRNRLQTQFLD